MGRDRLAKKLVSQCQDVNRQANEYKECAVGEASHLPFDLICLSLFSLVVMSSKFFGNWLPNRPTIFQNEI